MSKDFPLPDDLPVPEDDGAADHLPGMELPDLSLPATDGATVTLGDLPAHTVIYVYPMTGRPDEDVIPEGWEDVPGARGCTPESRGFRSHYDELRANGIGEVFGLSTQSSEYQREARDRLDLPFEMVSDAEWELTTELDLPMVSAASLSSDVDPGTVVTLDAERGIVYDDAIHERTRDNRSRRRGPNVPRRG